MTASALASSVVPDYTGLATVVLVVLGVVLAATALLLVRSYRQSDAERQARARRVVKVLAVVFLAWLAVSLIAFLVVKA